LSDDFPYRIHVTPDMESSNLVIGWDEDAGKLGQNVTDYLIEKLQCRLLCEIEPRGFFPMSGVSVENDVAQFPSSNFYYNADKKIVIFKSSPPRFEWYSFINIVLDIAERICNVDEIYTIGGMISVSAHTMPRNLMATMNASRVKESMESFDLDLSMDYETPLGQKPTMSSYILWAARQRNITGISLWVPIPFYLVPNEDMRANRRMIDFLNRKLMLGMDASDLNESVLDQNRLITRAIDDHPEIRDIIYNLETNVSVTEEDGQKLLKTILPYLRNI
jgi:predicted ATP-grasp superfamily ATP-dependent carboligase